MMTSSCVPWTSVLRCTSSMQQNKLASLRLYPYQTLGIGIDLQVSEKEKRSLLNRERIDEMIKENHHQSIEIEVVCEPGLPMVSPELAASCRNAQITCKRSWLEGVEEWKEPWHIEVLKISSPSRGQLDLHVVVHVDSTKKRRSR